MVDRRKEIKETIKKEQKGPVMGNGRGGNKDEGEEKDNQVIVRGVISQKRSEENGNGIKSFRPEREVITADKKVKVSENYERDETGKDEFGSGRKRQVSGDNGSERGIGFGSGS